MMVIVTKNCRQTLTEYFHRDLTHSKLCAVVYDAVNVSVSFPVCVAALYSQVDYQLSVTISRPRPLV